MGDFEFIVSDGPQKGSAFAFPGEAFVIGSGDGCHLQFEPQLVQARHAEIVRGSDGTPWIRDLTGNGLLWVNGQAVKESQLFPGTFVRMGRLEVVVRQVGQSSPSGTMSVQSSGSGVNKPIALSATMRTPTPMPSLAGLGATIKAPTPVGPSGTIRAISNPGTRPPASSPSNPGGMTPGGMISASSPGGTPADQTILNLRADTTPILPPGSVIDNRYRIISKIATGGMGEVYRAEHVELGKAIALKVMRPELSNDEEFVTRFRREAIASSRIGQQNIVDITDSGKTQDGRFYFVMEFLEGLTLASVVHRQGAMPLARAINVTLQVARALAAAHAQGIVHRDLKPENVMLLQRPGQPDFVKVLDFGVAKVAGGHGQGGQTAIGMVVGTPQYMSPEQAKGVPVDARTDIYALGLILYELLCGRPTFNAETPSMLMVKQITEQPPPLTPGPIEEVPPELEALVMQSLEKDAENRPATMETIVEFLDGLAAVVKASAPTSQHPRVSGKTPQMATPLTGSLSNVSGPFASASPPATSSKPGVVQTARVARPSREEVAAVQGQSKQNTDLADDMTADLSNAGIAKKSPLPMIIGAVVVLVLIAGGVMAFSGGEKPVAPTTTPSTVEPVKTATPVPTPPIEPTPVVVRVSLQSEPAGAEVMSGGEKLGQTPLTLEKSKGTVLDVTLSLAGYKSATQKVDFEVAKDFSVPLEKEKVAAPVAPTGKKPPKTPKGPTRNVDPSELKDDF